MGRSLDLLTDACAALNHTPRRMFGGHGFFAPNGGMFAGIVTDDEITFKLVGALRDELISLGGKPWVYQGMGKAVTMNDWIVVPEGFYDDPEAMAGWAAKAHAAAPAKKAKKAKKPAPKKKAAPKKKTKKR